MAQKWSIKINNFLGGLAPAYWDDNYPAFGNKNQAGRMLNIDLTNPKFMTQGPGLATLTEGDQAGAVSELVREMIDMATAWDTSYAIGKTKLQKFSATAVTNAGTFPHTIAGATTGQSIAYYHGDIFYSWYDGTNGDIGKYDVSGDSFDDDYMSTVPTGKASLQKSTLLRLLAAGNDMLYCGNKRYVSSFDGTTFTEKDLDLPEDCKIQDLAWHLNRLFVAANKPNLSGNNKNIASIYIWDGNAASWEDEVVLKGRVQSMYVKNNDLYVFWQDISGKSRLGTLDGGKIRDIFLWDGDLPYFYQITEYKNFLIWVSGSGIWAWGARDKSLPAMMFQLADGGYATVGGLACPFGIPIVASTNSSTNHKLAEFSGYDTNSLYKTLMFDMTGEERKSLVEEIVFDFAALATGARVDITINCDDGTSSWTETISYSGDGAITQKRFAVNKKCENMRVEMNFSNGSVSNPVKIKQIKLFGRTQDY